MSIERRKLLVAYGAKLVLTEGAKGMAGAIAKAEEIARVDPERYVIPAAVQEPGQSGDPRSDHRPRDLGRHRRQGRHLRLRRRHRRHHHRRLALPEADPRQGHPLAWRSSPRISPVITQTRDGEKLTRAAQDPGHRRGLRPRVLDLSLVDEVEQVTNDEAIDFARRLAREEGILSGISSGAAAAVAVRLAHAPGERGQDHRGGAARLGRALPEPARSSRASSTRRARRCEVGRERRRGGNGGRAARAQRRLERAPGEEHHAVIDAPFGWCSVVPRGASSSHPPAQRPARAPLARRAPRRGQRLARRALPRSRQHLARPLRRQRARPSSPSSSPTRSPTCARRSWARSGSAAPHGPAPAMIAPAAASRPTPWSAPSPRACPSCARSWASTCAPRSRAIRPLHQPRRSAALLSRRHRHRAPPHRPRAALLSVPLVPRSSPSSPTRSPASTSTPARRSAAASSSITAPAW